MSRLLLSGTIAAALAVAAATLPAQGRPYAMAQLETLIRGGLSTEAILRRANQNCLAFRIDEAAARQLRAVGAPAALIDGLRAACVRLPEGAAAPARARPDSARVPVADSSRARERADSARAVARDTARAAADTAGRAARPGQPPAAAGRPVAPVRTDTVRPPPGRQVAAPAAGEASARQRYSPGGTFAKSLVVPGLGHFGTRRPALGAVFLAGAAGALAFGVLSERVEIDCLARTTDGTCPSNQVRGEVSEKPMLIPGVAAFVALGVVSGLEAAAGARRANARSPQATPAGASSVRLELGPALADGRAGSTAVNLVRLRF